MKKAFSLLEMIFVIIIIGIVAGIGIPKLLNTKNDASISAVRQDVNTIITSVQSYYLVNGNISKISDAVSLNSSTWNISDTKVVFQDNGVDCISIEVTNDVSGDVLSLTVDSTAGDICKKINESGLASQTYNLD